MRDYETLSEQVDRSNRTLDELIMLRKLVRLADVLREAQKAYMAVRDIGTREEREPLGRAVAEAAANYDAERANG